VLAPVALAAELAGGLPFAVLVAVVGAIAFREWAAITGATEPAWLHFGAIAALALGIVALASPARAWSGIVVGLPLAAYLVLAFRQASARWAALGLLYIAVPCAAFVLLRQAAPFGWAAVLFVLFVVWVTDIAAYFGGRSIGGPKLWPRVSPKKTWSGALTGLVAGMGAGGLTVWLVGAGSFAAGFVLAAPLSIAAQAGDLLESAVKRRFGVKDSGHIIPGHGGVLDRVDGLLGAGALAWAMAALGLGGEILALPGAGS